MTLRGGILRRISAFLSITFDWIETQTWEWYQYVCLVKAHRLICNMTSPNHHVTLPWDDLRSNFEIDLSRSASICFEPARRENHIDVNPRPDTVFRHLRSDRGGWCDPPPLGVSKQSVIELSGKDQQIFGTRSIFDPVMAGQRSNFRKFYGFFNFKSP